MVVCSFCGETAVVAWFEGPTFRHAVESPDDVRATEAMLACAGCRGLVEADDRAGLAKRSAARVRRGDDPNRLAAERERHEREFWDPRSGPEAIDR